MKRTLAIIKPDAVQAGNAGKIIAHIEEAGFKIVAARMTTLSRREAGAFYEVHRERPFYAELVEFMSSGPAIPMVLASEGAVSKFRRIIGATDPAEAAPGTVRFLYAESKGRNAIHGSDSDENARAEIDFFFPGRELQ